MRNIILNLYPVFHRFTVFLAICYLAFCLYSIEVEVPEIAYLVQVLLPSLFNDLTGGSFSDPTDFVNHLKYKLCQIL